MDIKIYLITTNKPMYNTYFNFKEKPFKLVPNPDYLFMSKSHEVALAHLAYAMEQGDGFVVVTGEVGTGKTTLCRLFLERLDKRTESAYIFNPKLDPTELMETICGEFGINTASSSARNLLELFYDYLIYKNKRGLKIILMIDEAQNLTIENLEMVRMLSNLETTRQKLLQIILVGQPELSDYLDTYEMRQLSQRISLGCYLSPLRSLETEKYIRHRISIAAQRPLDLFSIGACRLIHKYAKGIPRLVNIAADRCLLMAYTLNRSKVNKAIARDAINEIAHRGRKAPKQIPWGKLIWGTLAFFAFIFIGVWLARNTGLQKNMYSIGAPAGLNNEIPEYESQTGKTTTFKIPITHQISETEGTETDSKEQASAVPQISLAFQQYISQLEPEVSRMDAVATLLNRWNQSEPSQGQFPPISEDQSYFEIIARQYGLRLYVVEDDWKLVERLNMPAIVALKGKNSKQPVYITLVGRRGKQFLITKKVADQPFSADLNLFKPHLDGRIYLFWKNIFGFDAVISDGSSEASLSALKTVLRSIGYGVPDSPGYDKSTKEAVLSFQHKHGIMEDGLVGSLTKILLILDSDAYGVPRLTENTGAGA